MTKMTKQEAIDLGISRYGRVPTEKEIETLQEIFEIDHNKVRCFFRGIWRKISI